MIIMKRFNVLFMVLCYTLCSVSAWSQQYILYHFILSLLIGNVWQINHFTLRFHLFVSNLFNNQNISKDI